MRRLTIACLDVVGSVALGLTIAGCLQAIAAHVLGLSFGQ